MKKKRLDFGKTALPRLAISSRGQLAAGQWSGGGDAHRHDALVSCFPVARCWNNKRLPNTPVASTRDESADRPPRRHLKQMQSISQCEPRQARTHALRQSAFARNPAKRSSRVGRRRRRAPAGPVAARRVKNEKSKARLHLVVIIRLAVSQSTRLDHKCWPRRRADRCPFRRAPSGSDASRGRTPRAEIRAASESAPSII